ncbi:hypothetical protein L7F22_010773 [Adiantum nelumboides]|nr:hypothetical protein [Adiantum nelumboides]
MVGAGRPRQGAQDSQLLAMAAKGNIESSPAFVSPCSCFRSEGEGGLVAYETMEQRSSSMALRQGEVQVCLLLLFVAGSLVFGKGEGFPPLCSARSKNGRWYRFGRLFGVAVRLQQEHDKVLCTSSIGSVEVSWDWRWCTDCCSLLTGCSSGSAGLYGAVDIVGYVDMKVSLWSDRWGSLCVL